MQVRANLKARHDTALMTAWFSVKFQNERRIEPLDHYLNPPTKADRKRGLLDMFRRIKAKGERGVA